MSAGVQDQRTILLPTEVSEAAGLEPGDQVEWRYENGEIRGRKVEPRRITRGLTIQDGQLVMDTRGLVIEGDDIALAVREERDRH